MNKVPLVVLKDICKTYCMGKVCCEALRGVSLDIYEGEYIAILGPSGSGKSTLMQIIGCLSTPTSGSYILSGQEVSRLKRNELARIRNKKVGFVFQNFNLLSHISIVDNVALPLVYQGIRASKREKLAKEILSTLGLASHFKHKPNELSGGQKQRVAIARALVTEPDILLADEPTGNLDSKSGADVIELFEECSRSGRTIIMVTHDMEIAKRTRRIIQIYDGQLKT